MKVQNNDYKNIPGWGSDVNEEDKPSYPMVQKIDNRKGIFWERPTQQKIDVEVLKSTERPTHSAVMGTTLPPRGLSGMIRRLAFKKSEGKYGHWLPLLMADRIDMLEGLVADIFTLKNFNIFNEMGIKSEWKYNKKGFFTKTFVVLGIIALLVYWID